jgi:CRISPR/Cas system-associated exonuclease Cas4 (RecB family)
MFTHCPPKVLPDLESVTGPDGKRYYTTPTGIKLPSVTTVVGAQSKQAIIEWRKRVGDEVANEKTRKATTRGTSLHNLSEKYLLNEPLPNVMPNIKELFLSVKKHLNRINNIHYIEQALWSTNVGMAGRVDCIAEFDGVLSVIDHKTAGYAKDRDSILSYFWQTAAYALMYEEMVGIPINKLVIIMAVENDQPLVFIENTKDHIKGLVDAIKFYRENTRGKTI